MKLIDLTGKKFGRLTVVEKVKRKPNQSNTRWLCECECGNKVEVLMPHLQSGHTRSCGCLNNEIRGKCLITHGLQYHRFYQTWLMMNTRCYDEKYDGFKYYGGRGISVCDEWRNDPTAFLAWCDGHEMIPDGYTLDRIETLGSYCPNNCRFASKAIQAQNQRMRNTNTSGHTGVYWYERDKKWEVKIGVNGKEVFVGRFDSFDDAVKVREEAEDEYHQSYGAMIYRGKQEAEQMKKEKEEEVYGELTEKELDEYCGDILKQVEELECVEINKEPKEKEDEDRKVGKNTK